MVNHIKELRNKKVQELMQEQNKGGEPEEEHAQHNGNLRPDPKRELIDLLPPIITFDVSTALNIVTSVNVLPSWRAKQSLQIELTQPNLDLLMEDPPAESVPWVSDVEHPNVQWIPCRNMFQCHWWDGRRERHLGLEFNGDAEDADKCAIVNGAAGFLQRLYDNKREDAANWGNPDGKGGYDYGCPPYTE